MRLLQVSDPHFGTERPEVVEGLLNLAHELVPDVVLLSGDITQRARRAQFAAARKFADGLLRRAAAEPPGRWLAVPGNHDIPLFDVFSRVFRPYAGFRRSFGDALEGQWQTSALQLTALNTTRPWRHKNGEISAEQIERVAQRLRRATPQQLRVVAAHHPMAVTREGERHNLMRGHLDALHRWAQAGADVVMGGHIHLPYVVPAHELFPELPRKLWVVQAGTAVSHRVRHEAGNSVNVLRVVDADAEVPGRHCRLERWDWADDRRAFVAAQVQELELSN